MPCFGRRIAEIFIFEIILSAVFTIAIQIIGATEGRFSIFMIICLAVNAIDMFICLRGYFFTVSRYRFYFKVNLAAYMLLALINIIMAHFNIEPFYTYMFFPYKLFMQMGQTKMVSALIIHGFFIAEILLANVLFSRIVARKEESRPEILI